MTKILLISIHYPPFNVIASERARAFAKYLSLEHEVHVLTADWVKKGKGQHFQIDEGEGYDESIENGIYLYRVKTPDLDNERSISKAQVLLNYFNGRFDGPSTRKVESAFNAAAISICKKHSFDFGCAVFSPFHHLKTIYRLNQRFGFPYSIDFRDLYNNRHLQSGGTIPFKEKLRDWFVTRNVKKWTSKAAFCTTVSDNISSIFESMTQVKTHTITNGFEPEDYTNLNEKSFETFTVVHCGSVYNNQNHEIFLEGFGKFCEQNSDAKVLFIGADLPGHENIPTGRIPNFQSIVDQYLSQENYEITPRVDRKSALSFMMAADVLYFPSFPDSAGTYSGKFFEYLGSRVPFLICPNDHDVVEKAAQLTSCGIICDTSTEVTSYLHALASDQMKLSPINETELKRFSREVQTNKLLDLIDKVLND